MLHFSRCGEASTETLEANVWNHQISIRKPVRTLELSHFDTFAGSHSAQGFAGKLPVDRNGFDKGLIRDRTVMKLARNRYIACGSPISLVWLIVLTGIGMKQTHRISTGGAAATVLAPYLLFCCLISAAGGALVMVLRNTMGTQ